MIGSRNRAASPSEQVEVCVGDGFTLVAPSTGFVTYIHERTTSTKTSRLSKESRSASHKRTRSPCVRLRLKNGSPCLANKTPANRHQVRPSPPRGRGNWLWRLTILHEWLEMSKQRGKRRAAYFSILLIPLLCVPPPSASDAFYLLSARHNASRCRVFPGAAKKKLWDVSMCDWIFFFFSHWFFIRSSQITTQTFHHPLGAAIPVFFFLNI